ncbi:MAG TPA: hypothetical protein DIS62_05240 [Candidatus Kerfeldbacteria bacterium]|nr:MAG: hypothetical protein UY34_C0005G0045 [Parcubacteria group bacterium GW2011_GWA2_48_9]KKW15917.1 MAG: hypothetical protein UY52_C0012G0004 [Parcubacteria group bacterium GW2011_GWC2_49_9]HCJ52512.1 hypothetical protein [Candidatus Kerfeldbacteria bacterium]HCM68368.1 hypothetical protein [Candidatus Kerfeldbacteria bacterium]
MKKGFTLIELLVVIGIIAILAGIVIIAVNPGRQLGQARDAQRWNDVNALLNGIHQYAVDFDGAFPAVIDNDDATVQIVGTGVACPATCTGQTVAVVCGANLTGTLVSDYLQAIPADPQGGSAADSRYYVDENQTTGRITIGSCDAEQSPIEVTR